MKSRDFWKLVTVDEAGLLERLLELLEEEGALFCVIGGQAVNAYVEPLVSLDLDLVLADSDVERIVAKLGYGFEVERFEHSVNVRAQGSDLRIQLQLDPRYGKFLERAEKREVLGHELPVARLEDVVRGKVWAASDPTRRPSKRQKDLADLARLLERYPEIAALIPDDLRARLV